MPHTQCNSILSPVHTILAAVISMLELASCSCKMGCGKLCVALASATEEELTHDDFSNH